MKTVNFPFLIKFTTVSILSFSLVNHPLFSKALANETQPNERNITTIEFVEQNLEKSTQNLQKFKTAQNTVEPSVEEVQKQIENTDQTAQEKLEVTAEQAEKEISRTVQEINQNKNWGWLGLLGLLGLFGLLGGGKKSVENSTHKSTEEIVSSSKR